MTMFLLVFSYIYFTFEVCPFFWDLFKRGVFNDPLFFYISFFVCFFTNYYIICWKESFNNNNDLIIKFFKLLFNKSSTVITYFLIEIKKFYLFLTEFKYKILYNTLKIFFGDKINTLFNFWKPLFKKWSYFGYYRTNRSKWIK